jgi:hypothetical protein
LSEYVTDGETGHVVPGVYGLVSWVDENSGELREDYRPMLSAPGLLTENLHGLILECLQAPASERAAIAVRGHRKVRDDHHVSGFNTRFKQFLDQGFQRQ